MKSVNLKFYKKKIRIMTLLTAHMKIKNKIKKILTNKVLFLILE